MGSGCCQPSRREREGIFPNDAAIVRLVGVLFLERNDERQLQRLYVQLEGLKASAIISCIGSPP
jgi:hypothetical protein